MAGDDLVSAEMETRAASDLGREIGKGNCRWGSALLDLVGALNAGVGALWTLLLIMAGRRMGMYQHKYRRINEWTGHELTAPFQSPQSHPISNPRAHHQETGE